jgi:glycerophosphoryl diester phosphodiesterase
MTKQGPHPSLPRLRGRDKGWEEWLTARPVAHRGLHDGSKIIENTASAFAAAIAGHYGIECDLQISADGEAMVHHDEVLGRLTEGSARLADLTAAELRRTPFRVGTDRMITLGDLCDLTAGRTPLIIELKSRYDGDRRIVGRTADVLSTYGGHAAVMSFDPVQMAMLCEIAPGVIRGIVAERADQHARRYGWFGALSRAANYCERLWRMQPQFVAYAVDDLPATMPSIARNVFKCPVLAWTVRNPLQREKATRYADQIIFEDFRP